MCSIFTIFIATFFLTVHCVSSQKEIGDTCTLSTDGRVGQCVLLLNCPTAIQALQTQQILPKTCGFRGNQPIVCCPNNGNNTPVVTTTTEMATQTPIAMKEPVVSKIGQKSKQKCKEYSKYVYEKVVPPILLINNEGYLKNECGIVKQELIVGGTRALPKEFPHMVLIGYEPNPKDKTWACGGTLISEQFVLTAGHCLRHRDLGEAKYVKLGDLDINNENDDARPQELKIIERIKNPNYTPPIKYNDIALLKLEKSVNLNPYVRPACLYTSSKITNEKAIATGWGLTEYYGDSSEALLKVTLELFDFKQCNDSYKYQLDRKLSKGIMDKTQLCAGSSTDRKDTCQGDSGGPLQVYNNDEYCMYDVIGVTSFGKGCGSINTPGVYTRISAYIEWIENTVWS